MTAAQADRACAGRSVAAVVFVVSVTLAGFAADLLTKSLAFRYVADHPVVLSRNAGGHEAVLPDHRPIVVVPKVLALKLTTNTGAVFGLGRGSQWLFIAASVVAVVALGQLFYVGPPGAFGRHLAIGLILAGALGNLYDRLMFKAVRDLFWLFPGVRLPFGLTWPGGASDLYPWLFNLADAALLVGVVMLVVILWRDDTPRRTCRSDHD